MLHTVHASPFSHPGLSLCLRYGQPDSDIVLLEDGVIAAIHGSHWQQQLKTSGMKVYALDVDLNARGILAKVDASIEVIDHKDFIVLTERHMTQLKW